MSNLVAHAKRELLAAGYDADDSANTPNSWMAKCILELMTVFAAQGHSGSSAPHAIAAFTKLARYEPLGPLIGDDSEWMEVTAGVFQNKRCGHVFKQHDRFNGQAYDLDGIVWEDETGSRFTNKESMVPITFPYTPTTEYRKAPK